LKHGEQTALLIGGQQDRDEVEILRGWFQSRIFTRTA
jgi:hypothetical protein